MKRGLFYIALLISFSVAQAQIDPQPSDSIIFLHKTDSVVTDKIQIVDPALAKSDSLIHRLDSIPSQPLSKVDSVIDRLESPFDSVESKLATYKSKMQQRIDSLKQKGLPANKWQNKLDSVNKLSGLPNEKLNKINNLEQEWRAEIMQKIPGADSIRNVQGKVKSAISEVNKVSTDMGVGPLGKDVLPQKPAGGVPDVIPDLKMPGSGTGGTPSLPTVDAPSTPDLKGPALEKPGLDIDALDELKEKTGKVKEVTGKVTGVTGEAKEITNDVSIIKEEGLARAEKLPETMEQQAVKLDEVGAFQKDQQKMTKEMKQYEELIKKYKEEKAIKEDLEKKSKELADDAAMKKITETELPKKMGKYKKKFSQVHDMRNLPKRPPNPMKGMSWRERVVPGLVLHTLSNQQVWLDFSPQVFYKLNGHWAGGVGFTYRMSLEPNRLKFDDFGTLYGTKGFIQYHAFKGFFARAEIEKLNWKPWSYQLTDPDHRESVYTAAVGIGKSYNITKKIKGNVQTLYHTAWNGSDPYRNAVLIRFGIDFSIKKKEKKPWDEKLKKKK